MDQHERRRELIKYLINEYPVAQRNISEPHNAMEEQKLLRGLLNVRAAKPISSDFIALQDLYLQERNKERGIVDFAQIKTIAPHIALWQGDITTLKIDAIVNAANSALQGCFAPNHYCIDNCIHTYAGVQLRLECARIIAKQGHEEYTGNAKITLGYNLPAKYVIHTVGPIVAGALTDQHREALRSCYKSILAVCLEHKIKSIAFCCISTGVFRFPNEEAAKIAIATVKEFLSHGCDPDFKVIFNVFGNKDLEIYQALLNA